MARRLVAALMAVGLLVAACAAHAGATEAAAVRSVASRRGKPVKMMVIYDGAGAAAFPRQPNGAVAAARRLERQGGIDGRPVRILKCDTRGDPNRTAECGRRAVEEDVLAVVGSWAVHSGEFLPLLEQHRIPAVGGAPFTAADFTSPASFPLVSAAALVGTLAVGLAEEGAERISLVRVDIAALAPLYGLAGRALEQRGLEPVAEVPVPLGAPDMTPYVEAATRGGVDGVLIVLSGQDALNFAIAAKQAHPDLKIAFAASDYEEALQALLDTLGDDADGTVMATPFRDNDRLVREIEDDFVAAGFGRGGALLGVMVDALSYVAVLAVAEVADGLSHVDHEALWQRLPTVQDLDIGIMPLLQFAEAGGGGIPRVFNDCQAAMQLVVGRKKTHLTQISRFEDPFTGEPCEFGPARLP